MNKAVVKLSPVTRVVLVLAGLAIFAGIFFPLWRFDFFAPQHPGGLWMYIWHDHFEGDIKVINGLNHYIGMEEIREENFPELGIIRYLVAGLAAFALVPGITGRRRWLHIWFALLILVAAVGIYDFWAWEYDYGHNLDPHAPIVNPGQAYQPPLIGYKRLMNFDIYSQPWTGAYLIIGGGVLLGLLIGFEFFRFRKIKSRTA
jgi:copper chaperone NosL